MATYYVRKTGSDGNGGTDPDTDAWQGDDHYQYAFYTDVPGTPEHSVGRQVTLGHTSTIDTLDTT